VKCISLLAIIILTPLHLAVGESVASKDNTLPQEVTEQTIVEQAQGAKPEIVVDTAVVTPPSYFPSPQSPPSSAEMVNTSGLIGQIFLYLGLIAFIGLLVIYISRKSSFPFRNKKQGSKLIISETRVLGNKQFLVVVEYGQKKFLLGVGPGMIKNLSILSSEFDEDLSQKESSSSS